MGLKKLKSLEFWAGYCVESMGQEQYMIGQRKKGKGRAREKRVKMEKKGYLLCHIALIKEGRVRG